MAAPEVTQQANAAGPSIFTPDLVMIIPTWVTFLTLLFILQKFAWKPILATLQKREDSIRTSLEQADKIQTAFTDIEASKENVLAEAHRNAQDIITQAQKRAQESAKIIEDRAKTHAQEILQSAHQQIAGEEERLKIALRREIADIAIGLAGKILKENVDSDKNRQLVDLAIKEL